MKRFALLLSLLPCLAAAQLQPKYTTGANAPLLQSAYATSAATTYYFATTGSDSNTCLSSAYPCLTPQGALNKAPKNLRHGVTLVAAAGTYPGFYVSGFTCDPGTQQSSGGPSSTRSAH